MRKVLVGLVVLVLISLVGCSYMDNRTIEFHDQSFNQFTYKGDDYTITNQIVDENDLGTLKEAFYKTLVIDTKNQKITRESNNDTITLAYNGLYNLSDGLAMSVNDSYYRVSLSSDLKSNHEMLGIDGFMNGSLGGQLAIDPSDCRVITFNDKKFRISSEVTSEGELKDFLGVIADSKTFIASTGKEIPKSDLNKIDYLGSDSDEEREVWDYGEVYSLKEEGTIAVEINNEYRIARLE